MHRDRMCKLNSKSVQKSLFDSKAQRWCGVEVRMNLKNKTHMKKKTHWTEWEWAACMYVHVYFEIIAYNKYSIYEKYQSLECAWWIMMMMPGCRCYFIANVDELFCVKITGNFVNEGLRGECRGSVWERKRENEFNKRVCIARNTQPSTPLK